MGNNASSGSPLSIALLLASFLAVYLGAVQLGLLFNFPADDVSSLWPASGVYLSALLLSPYRYWPHVVLTVAISAGATLLFSEIDLGIGGVFALANATESLLAAYIIRRLLARPVDFCSAHQVVVFFFAVISSTLIAAFLAATTASPESSYVYVVQVWWFANGLGMVIVTPLILTWARLWKSGAASLTRTRILEALALGIGLLLTCQAVFAWYSPGEATLWNYTYVFLPFLIWAALRFDPRGVATAAFLIAVSAAWHGARGVGPFSSPVLPLNVELLSLQLFLALITFCSQLLSAVVTDREMGVRKLRASEERFQQLADSVKEAFWLSNADHTEFLYVSPAFESIWGRSCDELTTDAQLFVNAVHEEDKERFLAFWSNPKLVEQEYRIVRPDGSVCWVRTQRFPILDAGGSAYRVAGVSEDVTSRKTMEAEMRQLQDAQDRLILQTQTEEREMLARELHDGVGQMLVGLQLKLASRPDRARDLADEIGDLQQTLETVSRISRLLNPPELEGGELTAAVDQHLTNERSSTKPVIELESHGAEPVLTRPSKHHLYRIIQEAVTNVRKHANAERVRIEMDWRSNSLALRVEDDGVGFPEQISHGIGVRNIQTRAWALDGRADWHENPSGGTTLEVSVPLASIVEKSELGFERSESSG